MADGNLTENVSSLFDAKGILTNLESSIVLVLCLSAFHWINRRLSIWFTIPPLRKGYGAIAVCFLTLYLLPVQEGGAYRLGAYAVAAILLALALRAIFKGYEDVGFAAAFLSTNQGVSFEKSLKMANGPLDFLGLGGDKLTKTAEFESAMIRCASSGRTVRLLLSPPDNPLFEKLARRNKVDPTQYSKNVKDSLGRIAKVKIERDLDIQVRFYPLHEDKDWQIFRLMFLNNAICLWSWTVWGPHLGTENPQVVLINRDSNGQTGAFNAFHDYFNRLWEDRAGQRVNLAEYG